MRVLIYGVRVGWGKYDERSGRPLGLVQAVYGCVDSKRF